MEGDYKVHVPRGARCWEEGGGLSAERWDGVISSEKPRAVLQAGRRGAWCSGAPGRVEPAGDWDASGLSRRSLREHESIVHRLGGSVWEHGTLQLHPKPLRAEMLLGKNMNWDIFSFLFQASPRFKGRKRDRELARAGQFKTRFQN